MGKSKKKNSGKQAKSSTNSTNKHSNNKEKDGDASIFAFSTLYIVVAFTFAIIAFLLGRAPLTYNFPILEKIYLIIPTFVTDLSNLVINKLGLHWITNDFANSNLYNYNYNGNSNVSQISELQPLTKNKISIDWELMATSYFNESNQVDYQCDLSNWIMKNNVAFNGYHVLCVEPSNDASNGRSIKYHRNGLYYNGGQSKQFIFDDFKSFNKLRSSLEKVLKIVKSDSKRDKIENEKDRWLPWAMFDRFGRKMNEENIEQLFFGIILIFEVGLFQYPPIEIGFERDVLVRNMNPDSVSYQPFLEMRLTTLAMEPVVLQVSGFIAPEYCDYIISDSEQYMRKSTVSHMHNTKGDADQWRTSSTHWLKNEDSIVHVIDCQTSSLTHIALDHQENVQVLRYFEGEQYDSHWDYFDPQLYKGTQMENQIRGGRNRFATLFWYMSNVTDGGWTYFPMAFDNPRPSSFKLKKKQDCNVGLKVEPRKGNAIIFYSIKPDGNVDPKSLHGACPVGEHQVKWGANKWIWTRPVTRR